MATPWLLRAHKTVKNLLGRKFLAFGHVQTDKPASRRGRSRTLARLRF